MNAGVSVVVQPSQAILPAVWKLMRLRWRITLNNFRRSKLISKIFTILALLGLMTIVGFVFWFSMQLVRFLRSPEFVQLVDNPTTLLNAVPALFFTILFLGILLTSFGLLLQALYLAADMDFLLAAPIPIRSVFITKLLQAVLPNFSISALFGLPVLYGLGIARGYNILYYPMVLLMMVVLALTAAGLASVLVMLVVRVFPARRVVEVLGFLGAILSFVCSQSGNLMNASRGDTPTTGNQMVGVLNFLSQLNNPWLPLNWPGQGVAALGEGAWLPGLGLTLLSLGLAAGVFWTCLQTAERWYYTGWASMGVVAQKKRPVRSARKTASSSVLAGLSSMVLRTLSAPVRGLVWKDALVLRRDLRNLSQLITPLIFGVIYGFMILRGGGEPPAGGGEAPEWFMTSLRTLLSYGNIGLSVFVGWMLLGRLASMGFSAEGKSYWMLKAAPLSARQMLTAKYLVAYLPSLALSLFFLTALIILQKVPIATAAYSLLVLALCLAGMTGILLAFGVTGANFKWEDPRRINAGKMGCLGSIVTILYLPLDLVFFLGPLVMAGFLGFPVGYGYLVGGVLGTGLSLLCVLLPLRLVVPLVDRLDEA
jgi:hypothetical protein